MRIGFRCDANDRIGAGHVRRCLALADELSGFGHDIFFISDDATMSCIPELPKRNYTLLTPDQAMPRLDAVLVDHYGLDRAYESAARSWAGKVFVIDDLADRPHDCDALVDVTHGRDAGDYKGLVPPPCVFFCGSRYAMMRADFLRYRSAALARRSGADDCKRVLLFFSTIDNDRMIELFLSAAENALEEAVVIDVVGSRNVVYGGSRHNVVFHGPDADMAQLMAQADIAAGSPGSTGWERCCLGLPSLLVQIADNQRLNASVLSQAGAAIDLGWHQDVRRQDIEAALKKLADDAGFRRGMSRHAAALCDGRGVRRLAAGLFCSSKTDSGQQVSLRLLEESDVDMLFLWQNEPGARKYFRQPEVPDYRTHSEWIAGYIAGIDNNGYLITLGEVPAGFVRVDRRPGNFHEVSIVVGVSFRGKGVAHSALTMIGELMPGAELRAEIHSDNFASVHLFLKSGYRMIEDRWFAREPFYIVSENKT